jgi:hypothetical protein
MITFTEALDALGRKPEDVDGDAAKAIALSIRAITVAIESKCGPVVKRTITEQCEPGRQVRLRTAPVVSLTTINGSSPSLTLRLHKRTGLIDGFVYAGADGFAAVVYVAGRCDDIATVPDQFKEAAKLALSDLWRREKSTFAGAQAFGGVDSAGVSRYLLPLAALQLLNNDLRPVVA